MVNNGQNNSKTIYSCKLNPKIRNKKFIDKKTRKPNYKYLVNSSKLILITRNINTIGAMSAEHKFFNLVDTYEKYTGTHLCNLSKNELLFSCLDYAEKTNSFFYLKDNSKQFRPQNIECIDILKLYLYKLFYPRVFDFKISNSEKSFESKYIKRNFVEIYKHIEFLILRILQDASLIATENACYNYIDNMRYYDLGLDISLPYEDCSEFIKCELNCFTQRLNKKSNFEKIANFLIPSIIFMAKHRYKFFELNKKSSANTDLDVGAHIDTESNKKSNKEPKEIKISTLLRKNTFYNISKYSSNKKALEFAYRECYKHLKNDTEPFATFLNLYYINKRSHIFDLSILSNNLDISLYCIEGILTKQHISTMLSDNNNWIAERYNESNLNLTYIANNPNYMPTNISSRDYEFIDNIIKSTAKSMQIYYLKNKDKDVNAETIFEFIECNNLNFSDDIFLNSINLPDTIDIDNNLFYKLTRFEKGLERDDVIKEELYKKKEKDKNTDEDEDKDKLLDK